MKILPIQYQRFNNTSVFRNNAVSSPYVEQNNTLSNVYYQPQTNFKGFVGKTIESPEIKTAAKKLFPTLFDKRGFIDLNELTFENFVAAKIDITKASPEEISAGRGYLALLEGYAKNPKDSGDLASQWGRKFKGLSAPLAVSHFLGELKMQEEVFAVNREMLKNPNRGKILDVPVFDENGNINTNVIVFDTETTGTNIYKDKIVQIGALLLQKGKVTKTYNQLINPEMHIPEGASAVNHITDEMVASSPKIQEVMKDFMGNIMCKQNGIIVTWNGVRFDLPLLNRIVREVRTADGIGQGHALDKVVMEKQLFKVVDAQIIHMRLHPFSGLSKKLGHQYLETFLKPMENAHDAVGDVGGTADMWLYDMHLLNKHRIDKSKPLTLRQVLLFQNGETEVPNLSIKLDPVLGINTAVSMRDASYVRPALKLANYFDSYSLKEQLIEGLKDEIGTSNVERFKKSGVINSVVDDTVNGRPMQVAETRKQVGTSKKRTVGYQMRAFLEDLFDIAKIDEYNGKSANEIREIIASRCKTFNDVIQNENLRRGLIQKNIDRNFSGNDLPDDEVARMIMCNK